jgi:hypothetical protein
MQSDPPVEALTSEQLAKVGINHNQEILHKRKRLGNMLRKSLETILELIAAADLYTDLVILVQLFCTVHHAWSTITVFSMLSPFFACQVPLIMFLKEKLYRDRKHGLQLKLMCETMVSPVMFAYTFVLDVIFMVNQAFVYPTILLLKLLTCNLVDLSCLIRSLDKSYEVFFEMTKLEAEGFRRMRTISQLTFETLIQMVLQIRMLYYFR